MSVVTRNALSRASIFGRGPLAVSASAVPSFVSRFHYSRLEPQNRFRHGLLPTSKATIFLSDMEKYRGGSQDNSKRRRQQRRNLSSDSKHRKDDKETETDPNPLETLIQSQNRFTKIVRQGAGGVLTLAGFVGSSVASLVMDRRSFEDRFVEPIQALQLYLKTSGVDDELSKSLNRRLGVNLCLLGRVQSHLAAEEEELAAISSGRKKKRRRFYSFSSKPSSSSPKINSALLEEARRYIKYATAVYGQAMMNAARVDAKGRIDGKVGRVSKESISQHISVPVDGIKLMDVSSIDGDPNILKHMVVTDHENQKVVLSIRGTFSLEEIILDIDADSREFCGGEAHSGMATMAERVWAAAGPTVKTELEANPRYEFILTGHSLGAGAACLVTILVQTQRLLSKDQKIRCFAYASPPVYTPLEFVPKSVESTTNFVHENDVIPFLSIQKVRKLLSSLRAVDIHARNKLSRKDRYKIILGALEPPKDLIAAVLEAEGKKLVPKKGAPTLYIPAEHSVWLKENIPEEKNGDASYRYELSNAREMSQREIRVFPDMLVDHFPARYEYALDNMEEKPAQDEN